MAKKVSFGTKPTASTPSVENWVSNRAIEPEAEPSEGEAVGAVKPESMPNVTAQPAAIVEKRKRLTLDIPESLHKAIKRKAADEGVPMLNLIQQVLERDFLD